MNLRSFFLIAIGLAATLIVSACAPTTPPPPTADIVSTIVRQIIVDSLTLTAAVPTVTPTLLPVLTLTPSPAVSPAPTQTPTFESPTVTASTSCWSLPEGKRMLISYVKASQKVELFAVGSIPGWYVIRSPYFNRLCWIEAIYLKLDPRLDTSKYRIMKPGESFSELP